jgi:hypothetical protein
VTALSQSTGVTLNTAPGSLGACVSGDTSRTACDRLTAGPKSPISPISATADHPDAPPRQQADQSAGDTADGQRGGHLHQARREQPWDLCAGAGARHPVGEPHSETAGDQHSECPDGRDEQVAAAPAEPADRRRQHRLTEPVGLVRAQPQHG